MVCRGSTTAAKPGRGPFPTQDSSHSGSVRHSGTLDSSGTYKLSKDLQRVLADLCSRRIVTGRFYLAHRNCADITGSYYSSQKVEGSVITISSTARIKAQRDSESTFPPAALTPSRKLASRRRPESINTFTADQRDATALCASVLARPGARELPPASGSLTPLIVSSDRAAKRSLSTLVRKGKGQVRASLQRGPFGAAKLVIFII